MLVHLRPSQYHDSLLFAVHAAAVVAARRGPWQAHRRYVFVLHLYLCQGSIILAEGAFINCKKSKLLLTLLISNSIQDCVTNCWCSLSIIDTPFWHGCFVICFTSISFPFEINFLRPLNSHIGFLVFVLNFSWCCFCHQLFFIFFSTGGIVFWPGATSKDTIPKLLLLGARGLPPTCSN